MSNFLRLKGNCPVCNGARKDCRQSKLTGLVHCLHSEANPPDYIFFSLDKQGFGMWAEKAAAEAASQQQREEWRQQRQLERQQRLDAERHQRSQLLSEPDRDREIRKLLAQLDLWPRHRENLRQRGLSDEQIQVGMFRSVGQRQKLETEISHRLAGVNIDGRSLTNYQAGLLCPIWNPQRQIIGWQLRLDNADNGKYRWPTSVSEKRPNGPTAHLTNGELPITCCRPSLPLICSHPSGEPQNKGPLLVEGILKPQITAQLSGRITIGAAGGNFASSREQVKATLAELKAEKPEMAGQPLTLCPDAGAIANKNVMRQYQETYNLSKKLGYELRVAWWNQISKDDLDIDDLLAAGRDNEIEIITWAEFKAIARNPKKVREGFNALLRQVTDSIKGLRDTFKGFGKPPKPKPQPEPKPQPKPQPEPDVSHYIPGTLPTLKECGGLGLGTIRYKEGQRKQIWQEAVSKRWKYILDKSAPGLGKSHTAGTANTDDFGVEKLFYFASNHRNPTTTTIEENYTDLPTRSAGMKRDSSHKTPLGRDFIVWPKKGEQSDIPGNCHRQPLFALLREKNISGVEGSNESPICQTCHLNNDCQKSSGEGYGFRSERRKALACARLRAHPNSMPSTDDDFNYSKMVAFWDEGGTLIQPMDQQSVVAKDLDKIMHRIKDEIPPIYEVLKPLHEALHQVLNYEDWTKFPKYGFDFEESRKLLPPRPENLAEIIEVIERATQFDEDLPDLIEEHSTVQKDLPEYLKRRLKEKSSFFEKLDDLTQLNWLVSFLRIWNEEDPRNSFRIDCGKLTISTKNDKHAELAAALKSNIFLDATASRENLAMQLGIDPKDILVIEQEIPKHENLRIVHVTGLGRLGKERSDSLKARVAALKNELNSRHPGIGYIEWLAHFSGDERAWFRDSRGSNEFQNHKVIASCGVPCPNIGYMQALYQALTGEFVPFSKDDPHPGLTKFIDSHIKAEIIQAIGRLRSHIRQDEELIYNFCGDYDLSFLDMPVEEIDAFNITPEAGTAIQQTKWSIFQAVKQLTEAGKKVTQNAIARVVGLSQGRISQVASEFGGWKSLKKILAFLLDSYSSAANNSEPLTEEELWLAKTYLPLVLQGSPEDALPEVMYMLKTSGWKKFEAIVMASPLKYRAKLIVLAVQALPMEVRQQIQSLAAEALVT